MKFQRVDFILGSKPRDWFRGQNLLANLFLLIVEFQAKRQGACILGIEFLSLRFMWLKCKVEDCILLDEDYLNGYIGSYFCFNFQESLFIIIGGNLHYK